MPILYTGTTMPLSLSAGQTLKLKELAGTATATGSTAAREDASAAIGAGFVVYGPQSSAASLSLTTTGICEWEIVNGDATPARDAFRVTPSGAATPDSLQVLANSGLTGSRKHKNVVTSHQQSRISSGSLSNRTYHLTTWAPTPRFNYVRIKLANLESSTQAVDAVGFAVTNSIASSSIVSSQGTTLTGNSDTGWVRATFAGSNTVTLPARVSSTQPSITYSDWMPVRSVAPVDGSPYPYIMARVYIPGTNFSFQSAAAGLSNAAAGLLFRSFVQNIAGSSAGTPLGITTPDAFTSTILDGNSSIIGLEFATEARATTILAAGDSVTQGQTAGVSNITSPYAYAVESLRQSGYNVSLVNTGWSGQTSATYAQLAKDQITVSPPDYAFYSVYTPNETLTQAVTDAMFVRAMDFCNFCLTNNVEPVMAFLTPNNNLALAEDNLRKSLYARAAASGFKVMNVVSAVGDGASPERYMAGMNTDAFHENQAGQIATGAAIKAWALANLYLPKVG